MAAIPLKQVKSRGLAVIKSLINKKNKTEISLTFVDFLDLSVEHVAADRLFS